LGGIIKSALRNEWETDPLTLQMMFAADRSHHISSEIDPALKNDKVVICDRYVLSSLAFGSVYISLETLKQLNVYFRKPNLTIIVDTHPKMCIERMKKARHHVEMFEKEQKLEQIRKNYIALRNYFPETYFVDGNKSADEVMTEIRKIVESKI
jgi:dTMP kinase